MTRGLLLPAVRRREFALEEGHLIHIARNLGQIHSVDRALRSRAVIETFALGALKAEGARTPGVDGITGRRADKNLAAFMRSVLLVLSTFQCMAPVLREIPKEDGTLRPSVTPTLAERGAGAHCSWLLNILFRSSFVPGVFGYLPGLGSQDALEVAMRHAAQAKTLVKVDIKDFFGSVDHRRVLDRIARRARAPRLLHLVEALMQRPLVGDPWPRTRGIAQGCPASPVLANILAIELDQWLGARVTFVRYADDIVLFFTGNATDAERLVRETGDFLLTLDLELAGEKTVIADAREGVPFLGHTLFKNNCEGHVLPHPKRVRRFEARVHELAGMMPLANTETEVQQIKNQLFNQVRGFVEYFRPHHVALEIATRAFHEAAQSNLRAGMITPVAPVIPGGR